MKPKSLFTLLVFFALSANISIGQAMKDITVLDYGIIGKTIGEKVQQYAAGNVLVVMDIDNTILTGDSDLGSDIWYQWQQEELEIKPTTDRKLTSNCLFDEAIGLLYELGTMSLTDTLLPGYIMKWQEKGGAVFALTSRSPGCRAATERELRRNDIDLRKAELETKDGERMVLSDSLERKFTYIHGIMMTSGMNKGKMLSLILDTADRSFKSIIFVEDTRKNIDAVKNKYSTGSNSDIVLFHYTKIVSDRLKKNNNVVLTPEQAEKMDQDWDLLIRLLSTLFRERVAKMECTC